MEDNEYTIPNVYLGSGHGHKWIDSFKNQGCVGSCASFSVAECLKYIHADHVSPSYLFILAKEMVNSTQDDGLDIGNVMRIACDKGTVNEEVVKDFNFQQHMENERAAGAIGKDQLSPFPQLREGLIDRQQLKRYYRFSSIHRAFEDGDSQENKISKLKNVLQTYKIPVSMAIPMGNGTHALTVFGFRNDHFLLKNSWGPEHNPIIEYKYSRMGAAFMAWYGLA